MTPEELVERRDEIYRQYPVLMCGEYEERGLERQGYENARTDNIAALWGFAEMQRDKYGWAHYRFVEDEIATPAFKGIWVSFNRITLGEAPNGMWAYSIGVSIGTSGYAGPVGIYDIPFESRDAALSAAVKDFRKSMERVTGAQDVTQKMKSEIRMLEKWLRDVEACGGNRKEDVQLCLF